MNSSRPSTFALLLCMAGQVGLAQAPPPPPPAPITMQQAVDRALAHNPVLLSAQQNLLSMKGQEVEAGLRQNPDFAFSGSDITLPANNPGNPYYYSASPLPLIRARAEAALAPGQRAGDDGPDRGAVSRSDKTDHAPGQAKLHQSTTGQSDFETGAGQSEQLSP